MESCHQDIKQLALEQGFLDCGVIPAGSLVEEASHFDRWLGKGLHGSMSYMERNREKRLDPRLLHAGTRSVVVVLQNYFTRLSPTDHSAPIVSKYALGLDYHQVIKQKLNKLLQRISQEITPCSGRAFVDSAPVLERAWAHRARLGWIGKNSMLISPAHGSFFFIGILLIDADLTRTGDTPVPATTEINGPSPADGRCGTCTRCIDACPTGAIVSPCVVDARRCISYLTIEHKGEFDPEFRGKLSNRIFGCDICQEVCPWNRKAREHDEPLFRPATGLLQLTRDEWYTMDEERFREISGNSPLRRTGFEGIRRNLQYLFPVDTLTDQLQ